MFETKWHLRPVRGDYAVKNLYILDSTHAIDLDEILAIEFNNDKPITNDGRYRIKIVFKGHGHTMWFDVYEEDMNRLYFKIMGEDRIC